MSQRTLPLYLPVDWPDYAEIPSRDVWARAIAETAALEKALLGVGCPSPRKPMSTPESTAYGRALMAAMAPRAAAQKTELAKEGAIGLEGQLQVSYFNLDPATFDQVLYVVEGLPVLAVHNWLNRPCAFLQESPLEALREGRLQDVLASAHAFAQG